VFSLHARFSIMYGTLNVLIFAYALKHNSTLSNLPIRTLTLTLFAYSSFLYSHHSQKESNDPLKECHMLRDDYLECLHHRKELTRVKEIQKQDEINKDPVLAAAQAQRHGGGSGGH